MTSSLSPALANRLGVAASEAASLPVAAILPELHAALLTQTRLVLEAPPGAGKTTLLPLSLLDAPWLHGRRILVLEPRRVAARAAARRMARLLGEEVGHTVGYRVRLDSRVSAVTRIVVMTGGVLTRMLQDDPALEQAACVVFDEFHERSLDADLGLALCLESQSALRDDLRLLVMSATLNSEAVAALLAPCAVVRASGRAWPVRTEHCPSPTRYSAGAAPDLETLRHLANVVEAALVRHAGSVLVFLPGIREIRRVETLLEGRLPAGVGLHLLYGEQAPAAQDAALAPPRPSERHVVLATAIAESSLTLEGVEVVVDSGFARTMRYDPGTGMSRLVTERVSLAGADQRRGRAGRLGPGVCYRLWSLADEAALRPAPKPEMLEADLSTLGLELAAWGSQAHELRWLDAPPKDALRDANRLLCSLGALEAAQTGKPEHGKAEHDEPRLLITARGRAMLRLPLHPRLAHMLLEAPPLGLGVVAPCLAALAGERDLLPRTHGVDIRARLALLAPRAPHESGRKAHGNPAVARLRAQAAQIQRLAATAKSAERHFDQGAACTPAPLPWEQALEQAGLLLALAYPERVARRREGSRGELLLASGQGARLAEEDPLGTENWLAVGEVDGGCDRARVHQAAPLARADLERLFGGQVVEVRQISWDARDEAVLARHERRLGALVLDVRRLEAGEDEDAVRAAVLEGISSLGLGCLPWTPELMQWRARLAFVRVLKGDDAAWPDCTDAGLMQSIATWLGPYLGKATRRSHFGNLPLAEALHSLLPWGQSRDLEALAPAMMRLPSGTEVRLDYNANLRGDGTTGPVPPVLAAKLQELFGQTRTPVVGNGQVPVSLHLLSPAGRPLQVTADLESFWKNGYPAVRAEMRGRYPKHPWPEDPATAEPTRLTSRALAARNRG